MIKGKVAINQGLCKGCGLCVDACPQHALFLSDVLNAQGYRTAALNERRNQCTGCAICALVCPDVVFTVWREHAPTRHASALATAAVW